MPIGSIIVTNYCSMRQWLYKLGSLITAIHFLAYEMTQFSRRMLIADLPMDPQGHRKS